MKQIQPSFNKKKQTKKKNPYSYNKLDLTVIFGEGLIGIPAVTGFII